MRALLLILALTFIGCADDEESFIIDDTGSARPTFASVNNCMARQVGSNYSYRYRQAGQQERRAIRAAWRGCLGN